MIAPSAKSIDENEDDFPADDVPGGTLSWDCHSQGAVMVHLNREVMVPHAHHFVRVSPCPG